jgi:plastocyanin
MTKERSTMKPMRVATLVLALLLVLGAAACGGGDESNGDGAGDGTTEPTDDGADAPPTDGDVVLTITAPEGSANSGFAETELSAPADTDFTIHFINDDPGIPHNVEIFEGTSTSGDPVWAPDGNALINGPAEEHYEIPPLPAGTYTYNCFAHPVTMVGTLTVA